ncbi:RDD family protein [Xanthomonas sp. MUS 060]|uniref:RDD family protein n=1 Tax=Xanthomonas sp. MUS 060 TaxID=1588031 RepID=UPI0005F2CEA6|nr:RDD family protein [Xanthomonas sp. MUS 060]
MREWYYADAAQQQHGPMPATDLQQCFQRGEINLSTLVWRDGLSAWRKLAECADELDLTQPPAHTMADTPPTAPQSDQTLPDAWKVARPVGAQSTAASAWSDSDSCGEVVQAGFWKRVAAHLIDGALVSTVANGIQFVIMLAFFGAHGFRNPPNPSTATGITMLLAIYLLQLTILALYYGLCHSSTKQATLGKMVIGIKVVRGDGSRISFARAIGRYFGFMLSGMTIGLGFLMAAFTERKQALHDMLCDTLVVDKWAYTDHPERQQRKLGTATVVTLTLFGILISALALLIALLLISLAAQGKLH